MTWIIEPAPIDSPAATATARAYLHEVVSRYDGHPVSEDEIDLVLAEEPHDNLAPPHGTFLLARSADGDAAETAAGCVGVHLLSRDTAEIRRLWVAPAGRRTGLGSRLLAAAEAVALAWGAVRVRLDTRSDLTEARHLYAAAGYTEIPRYNDSRYSSHWFEKRLPAPAPRS